MFVPLIDCDFCSIGYEPEDIFEIDGQKLCRDCKQTYHQQVEQKRIEDQIQQALNELPMDQLLTLELSLAISQQSVGEDVPENVQLWMMRINEALNIKAPNARRIGSSPVIISKTA